MPSNVVTLASGITTVSVSNSIPLAVNKYVSFQGVVSGTGAVSATVLVEVSNDNSHFLTLGTLTLTGTTTATAGITNMMAFRYVRANVTVISGTGASVSVILGI